MTTDTNLLIQIRDLLSAMVSDEVRESILTTKEDKICLIHSKHNLKK